MVHGINIPVSILHPTATILLICIWQLYQRRALVSMTQVHSSTSRLHVSHEGLTAHDYPIVLSLSCKHQDKDRQKGRERGTDWRQCEEKVPFHFPNRNSRPVLCWKCHCWLSESTWTLPTIGALLSKDRLWWVKISPRKAAVMKSPWFCCPPLISSQAKNKSIDFWALKLEV